MQSCLQRSCPRYTNSLVQAQVAQAFASSWTRYSKQKCNPSATLVESQPCRRFYAIIHKSLRQQAENLQCLLDPAVIAEHDESKPSVIFRLGVSSFPVSVHYRVLPRSSEKELRIGHTDTSDRGADWCIVDRERFMGFMHERIRRHENARRRKASKILSMSPSMRRRSTKEDAAELRRERIRKSRRKFKWFYDRQETSNDGQPENSPTSGDKSNEDKRDAESETEVMAWLRDLDFNNCTSDL